MLALTTAATLFLAVVLLFLLAAPPRPAKAILPGTLHLAPELSVSNPSVVVNERQTATNSDSFDDTDDTDSDFVRITASEGTITQSGSRFGTWSWSMAVGSVPFDESRQVKITARDSTGRSTSKYFTLSVKDVDPPANDPFSSALDLHTVRSSTTTGDTSRATMEADEPRPSSPAKDCGIYGHDNSVWFKFTYGSIPSLNASYNFDTQGSNFDTVLALYEGSSLSTMKQIECSNDNSLPNWNDKLIIPQSKLSYGQTYYVQLTGTGGARSGKYQLNYDYPPCCVGPILQPNPR
jgi:hypothetical protein